MKNFQDTMKNVLDDLLPLEKRQSRPNQKCWITNEIINAALKRRKLFKTFLEEPTEESKLKHAKQRKLVKKMVKERKKAYYAELLS